MTGREMGDAPDPHDWWCGTGLERFLRDLLAAELGRMRAGQAATPSGWWDALPLGEEGLGADYLERPRLGEAVAEALDLRNGPDALGCVVTLGEVTAEARRACR